MPKKTCFYELLEIDATASDLDIKKAYRKKALELHPDKNRHRIEEATRLFSEIQGAYQVLSDPHERSWYDSHKNQILGDDEYGEEAASNGVSVSSLMKYFTAYSDFSDSEYGFYATYRTLFELIEKEEQDSLTFDSESVAPEIQSKHNVIPDYTSFGNSTSTYQGLLYNKHKEPTSLEDFYNKFLSFSTVKSFRWHDTYNLRQAPDRRTRRMMEKDNKKARIEPRLEYNDCIRNLASFIKKRDPRVLAFNRQEEARQRQREKEILAHKKKMHLEKKEKIKNYQEPEWSRIDEHLLDVSYNSSDEEYISYSNSKKQVRGDPDEEEMNEEGDIEVDSNENDDGEDENIYDDGYYQDELFCVACNRLFKSAQQMSNHENSKKHIKNVKEIKKQMQKDASKLEESEFEDALEEFISNDEKEIPISPNSMPITQPDLAGEIEVSVPSNEKSKKNMKDISTPVIQTTVSEAVEEDNASVEKDNDLFSSEKEDDSLDGENGVNKPLILDSESDVDWNAKKKKGKKKKGKNNMKSATSTPNTSNLTENINKSFAEMEIDWSIGARKKKKAKVGGESASKAEQLELTCNICLVEFPTRNMLFAHIKETGHASLLSDMPDKKKKKKK